jgi:epoxyqueuosine reductase
MDVKDWLTREAKRLGFDAIRVANAAHAFDGRLTTWLEEGHHASMDWMEERQAMRGSPAALWPEARSAIVIGLNYGPDSDPLATLAQPEVGTISVYARHRDYHDVIKGKLKELAQKLVARAGGDVKVFVDTAPLMEKPLAQAAGMGWQGKHTVLVSRDLGNWLFLGVILTTLGIQPDEPEIDHCGSCRRCLSACPTNAFPSPYVLDSRRCISYLTIEHKGPIDRELRPLMGNRIYGCDDCLAVCPWNKFAEIGREAKLQARDDLNAPKLVELLALDNAAFRTKFTGSPIKRTGRDRFIRNVLIAAGNTPALARSGTDDLSPIAVKVHSEAGQVGLANAARRHLCDPNPVIRGAAIWALARLDPQATASLKPRHMPNETDQSVRDEWEAIQ